jgi:molybdopterin synthase sulfur carrier subunit
VTSVRIPPVLRPEAGGQRTIEVAGPTVRAALEQLVEAFPSLRPRILAGGQLPAFINVFVDGDDVRMLDGLDTPVGEASTIVLLPAVAGGRPEPSP